METVGTPQSQPKADRPLDETQTTNWQKIILAAVLGLGLLAGSAYAGYWYGTQEISNLKNQIPEITTPEVTPSPTQLQPEDTDISDLTAWQEKSYPDLGVSLKIPPKWVVKREEVDSVRFYNYNLENAVGISPGFEKGHLKLVINTTPSTQTVGEYLQKQKEDSQILWGQDMVWETAPTTLDGQPATKLETGPYQVGFAIITKHPTRETIVDLSFGNDFDNYLELASKILSTFKFLD